MPYINPDLRPRLDKALHQLENIPGLTVGEVNYYITRLLLKWLGEAPGYARYSAARGVLQDVTDELYRRWMGPYEQAQMEHNGDVI
jgi:hypothetical protein